MSEMRTAALKVAPYGSWISPITSSLIVSKSVGLSEVKLSGDGVYWLETRPQEQGRSVVVRRPLAGGKPSDLIRRPFSARTRVHEYGGGAWTVADGTLYFSDDRRNPDGKPDQRLYRQRGAEAPVALVPEGRWRYADGTIDRERQLWIGICEDHTDPEADYPSNAIVRIKLKGRRRDPGTIVAAGHDFFSSPRLSPDGSHLAFLAWDHPNMPWDGTGLYVCELDSDGGPKAAPILIAGGPSESIFQPEWLLDGSGLCFATDRNGWWNLCIHDFASGRSRALTEKAAEFGRAQWVFGMSTYAFAGTGRVVATYTRNGVGSLALIDVASGRIETLDLPFSEFHSVGANADHAVFCTGGFDRPSSVVVLDLRTRAHEVVKQATDVLAESDIGRYLSKPEVIEFPTGGGKTAFGIYYPPANPDYAAPSGEKPPLRVRCHGGPTSASTTTLSLSTQFWTSRGIAVLDVNYGGSTGYGREYRNRLHHQWGVVDVDDSVAGAKFLADRNLVDPRRLVISGGSAGGYTTLAALAFRDTFQGGTSYYGVSDLAALASDTHKFEARYLDWLIGPYPQAKSLYDERSPLRHAKRLSKPVLFLQGEEDAVVPPSQTEAIVEALRRHGVTAGYLLFSGEHHGFQHGPNIQRALDAELYFYAFVVFGARLAF